MKRTIIATALILSLSGCSTVNPLEVFTKPIEKTPLKLDDPEQITLDKIKWRVITKQNANEIFEKLDKKNIDPVLIGLTDNDYENLSSILTITFRPCFFGLFIYCFCPGVR